VCFDLDIPGQIRVNALVCMGKLVPTLEKWMIAEQILPALTRIQSREPGVLMAVLG
jgi:SCY1-like protein 2